jgi:predicted ester cyclase
MDHLDLVFYIEDLLADSVNVSCRWVARGTHKGQFWDYPPTNEEMLLRGMFLAKVKEGNQKITDLYIFWNISTVYSMV